jgi:thiol-disulfide isomerase/thioredoxin
MKKAVFYGTKTIISGLVFVLLFALGAFAQKKAPTPKPTPNANLPKVAQIDESSIKTALKPNGKPLLVNFWATWCDPCREEFPDLVRLDAEYKGKIDFITISLDDLAEINRDVPKFLADMKAEMPAYLLKVADEGAVISSVAKDWQGGLPFTILYNEKGELAYFRQGKVKIDVLKAEIDKLIVKPAPATAFQKGRADAQKDAANSILTFKAAYFGRRGRVLQQKLKETYGINVEIVAFSSNDANSNIDLIDYSNGYNAVSEIEIEKKAGEDVLNEIKNGFGPFARADVNELILTVNRRP